MIPVSVAIFLKKNSNDYEVLMQLRRDNNQELNNKWEFPGGKIENNESPIEAIKREILEELGVDIELGEMKLFKIYKHHYQDRAVLLYVFVILKDIDTNNGKWHKIGHKNLIEFKDKVPKVNEEILKDLILYYE